MMIQYEFTKSQARWTSFLKTLEPQFVGISGAARNFYATLVFGLNQLVHATATANDFKWSTVEAQALARFLVQRMVNARAAMLHSAEDEHRELLMEKIFSKLAEGPLEHRAIVRKFHSLPTTQCLELLNHLEDRGRVALVDSKWQRVETVNIPAALSN
jgi:predicted Rossmann fold nucleotide-binding protein DprA/Smf involved in DNA uptake